MEITINDGKIDFALESEKTGLEVYQAVGRWLSDSGLTLESFRLDDGAWSEDAALLANVGVASIRRLDLKARSDSEIRLQKLTVMYDYFDILTKALSARDPSVLRDFIDEFPYVREGLLAAFSGDQFAFLARDLADIDRFILELAPNRTQNPPDSLFKAFGEANERIGAVLLETMKELLEPEDQMEAAASGVETLLPRMGNISVLLQAGKDQEAMTLILTFSELSLKILRIIPVLVERGVLRRDEIGIEKLNSILHELTKAFEARDTVLIGDLVEYEIVERFQALLPILKRKTTAP